MFTSRRSCPILLILNAVAIFYFSEDVQAQSQANNNLLSILTKGGTITPNKAFLLLDLSQDLQQPISTTYRDFVPEIDIRIKDDSIQNNGRPCQGNQTTYFSSPNVIPLVKLGEKFYYFQMIFKANFFKAIQYCNYHGLHVLTIDTKEESDKIITYMRNTYPRVEKFWTSGSDLAEEGNYIWLSTGKPLTYTNWNKNQPDNAGRSEHCLEMGNVNGNAEAKWNDINCSQDSYFICEQSVRSTLSDVSH